jgi:hypothetical protein
MPDALTAYMDSFLARVKEDRKKYLKPKLSQSELNKMYIAASGDRMVLMEISDASTMALIRIMEVIRSGLENKVDAQVILELALHQLRARSDRIEKILDDNHFLIDNAESATGDSRG